MKLLEQWRALGPLGKLHNLIVYLQASPQRLQVFMKLSKGRRPVRDNKTRWNSWSKAIRVATTNPIHDAIIEYFENYADKDCKLDQLSTDDWELLRQIQQFLECIEHTTKALESNQSTIDRVLPAMDFVLKQFEDGKCEFADHPTLSKMFNSGWSKLEKYYQLSEDTPVYVAALILHPRYKWQYLDRNWKKAWTQSARRNVITLWETYKPRPIPDVSTPSTTTTTNRFLQYLEEQDEDIQTIDDEYEHYCKQPQIKVQDARKWWMEASQQQLYPNLSQMALDILSIPGMSAEPERTFSATKLIITDIRTRLSIKMIQALACLKSWYKLKELGFILADIEGIFAGPKVVEGEGEVAF